MPINEAAHAIRTAFVSPLARLLMMTQFFMLRRASHMKDTKPSIPVSRMSSKYSDCVCDAPSTSAYDE